jgi:hypothetical protein
MCADRQIQSVVAPNFTYTRYIAYSAMPAKIIPRTRKLGHERFNDRLNQPKNAANIINARNIVIDALFGLIFLLQLAHLKFQGLNALKK